MLRPRISRSRRHRHGASRGPSLNPTEADTRYSPRIPDERPHGTRTEPPQQVARRCPSDRHRDGGRVPFPSSRVRGLHRGRDLLHAQRVPHHDLAPGGARRDRVPRPRRVLRSACAPAPPRPRRRDRALRGAGRADGIEQRRDPAHPCAPSRPSVRRQLGGGRGRRPRVPLTHLEPRDRGAVLPRLAAARPGRLVAGEPVVPGQPSWRGLRRAGCRHRRLAWWTSC